MRLAELQYDLPPELIAQHPVTPRDASRLLVLDRTTGRVEHRGFRDILDYLQAGDALVVNNTQVLPARFYCRRTTGAHIEALFLQAQGDGWRVLLKPAARVAIGEALLCENGDVRLHVTERGERGEFIVRPAPTVVPFDFLARHGQTPLPPYIHRERGPRASDSDSSDAERYQTVYACSPGAVAAPTAGLHFTPELLSELDNRGVRRAEVTLHVGPGTFTPITADNLADHRMHAEYFEVPIATVDLLQSTRASGRRVLAVGTTSVRVLETLAADGGTGILCPSPGAALSGWTELFIYPPYRFRRVDRLLTNFHQPGSSLLALVMAFATPELVRKAYAAAAAKRYRFFSYGDAMLVL